VSSTQPHQAIYRRWRAQTFGQIIGQDAVVETLRNAVRTNRVSQAVLFAGPRGTGKTSLARILAKAINCTDLRDGEPCDACSSCVAIREGRTLDLLEIDAASNRGIDAIRDLRERVHYPPGELARRVYILDEAHQITRDAWPVLLKTLEEPPEFVSFMFASTLPSGFPAPILSRVQRFDLRPLTVAEIAGKLRTILDSDGRTAEPQAIDLISRLAEGGMRNAESMLDQLLSTDSGTLTAERVRGVLGLVEEETVDAFLVALVSGEPLAGIELLEDLEARGRDLRAFTEQAIERLRLALIASLGRGTATGLAAAGPAALTAAARRLASIDPIHPGPGGLRLQLELALLAPTRIAASAQPPAPTVADRTAATPSPSPKPDAAARPGPGLGVAASSPVSAPPPSPTRAAAPKPATPEPAASSPAAAPSPSPGRLAAAQPSLAPEQAASSPAAAPSPSPGRLAAAQPSPALAPNRTEPTLELLLQRWAEIVEVVSKSPVVKPLIQECRPVGVDGTVVTLGFPEAKSFYKDVAERRRALLEDGVSRVLGMPVSVRCVAANIEVAALPEDPDGARLVEEFRRIYGEDAVDVRDVD
jgi:DNA polymerase-3 subunit gamma/tau